MNILEELEEGELLDIQFCRKTYITFGYDHIHKVNDKILDINCVAVINHTEEEDGRAIAFELFGDKFCIECSEKYWEETQKENYGKGTFNKMDRYYPRGYITVREIE